MEPVTTAERSRRRLGPSLLLVALVVVAAATTWIVAGRGHAETGPAVLTISSAVVSEGDEVASGYLVITNDGGADQLVAVAADVAATTTVHSSRDRGGTVVMEATRVDVPGRTTTRLRPGGDHLMLDGLRRPLRPGGEVVLTLSFRQAGEVVVRASVESYAEIARSLEEATP